METLLKKISERTIKLSPQIFNHNHVKAKWVRNSPASNFEIIKLEKD